MRKIEELCIKYLMNETDPSETAQIRAEIIDDSDALIEYESMRATFSKVNDLPQITPPEHIVQAVLDLAETNRKKKSSVFKLHSKTWIAAAGIIFVALTGLIVGTLVVNDASILQSNVSSSNDKHWVDKNDIITLTPGNQQATLSSENSTKLKPVIPSPQQEVENTDIQLAGSKQVVIKQ
jgi:hypothetical protein